MTIAALTDAIENDERDKVRALATESLINKANEDGITPLAVAAMNDRDEIIEILVKKGAEINKKCESGQFKGLRPIDIAAEMRDTAALKMLIKLRAKVDSDAIKLAQTNENRALLCKASANTSEPCRRVIGIVNRNASAIHQKVEHNLKESNFWHKAGKNYKGEGHSGGKRTKRKARSTKRKARKTRR